MMNKYTIKDFWWFHNIDCWKIKRAEMVDMYFYVPTGKYIYKSTGTSGKWYGKKTYIPAIELPEKEQKKIKIFENEDKAVRWLAGIK